MEWFLWIFHGIFMGVLWDDDGDDEDDDDDDDDDYGRNTSKMMTESIWISYGVVHEEMDRFWLSLQELRKRVPKVWDSSS